MIGQLRRLNRYIGFGSYENPTAHASPPKMSCTWRCFVVAQTVDDAYPSVDGGV